MSAVQVVVMVLVSVAACGGAGDGEASAGGARPDYSLVSSVCALLHVGELEVALGERYTPGTDRATFVARENRRVGAPPTALHLGLALDAVPAMTRCYYNAKSDAVEIGVVSHLLGEAVWRKMLGAGKRITRVRVQGVGEAAVWDQHRRLLVLNAGQVFGLALPAGAAEDALGDRGNRIRAVRLARLALSRMQ